MLGHGQRGAVSSPLGGGGIMFPHSHILCFVHCSECSLFPVGLCPTTVSLLVLPQLLPHLVCPLCHYRRARTLGCAVPPSGLPIHLLSSPPHCPRVFPPPPAVEFPGVLPASLYAFFLFSSLLLHSVTLTDYW